jgi:two-component system phosphate regulon sensor histidine kinase PhoR
MKNSWKRFEVWVIGLRTDAFLRARLESTALYTLSVFIAFLVAKIILLPRAGAFTYAIVLLGLAVIGYIINDRVMLPIRKIIRAQRRFIADASHELRTPLAIIKTNSEITLLDGNHISPKDAKETLTSSIEEIDRMSKMIENLLSLSYYDSSVAEIKSEEVDLSKLVVEVANKIKSIAKKKSIELQILKTDPALILASAVAIEQIIINLIKNAVAYTPEGGRVSISVTNQTGIVQKHNVVELKVKDTGVGISREDLPYVFNPFYKSHVTRDRPNRESTGLGLTIVKKIVERYNGSIYINSALGKGTTVIIGLPLYYPQKTPPTKLQEPLII